MNIAVAAPGYGGKILKDGRLCTPCIHGGRALSTLVLIYISQGGPPDGNGEH